MVNTERRVLILNNADMKTPGFVLTILLALVINNLWAYSFNVTGNVVGLENGNPISNHQVIMSPSDSMFIGIAMLSTYTDETGNYSLAVDVPDNTTISFVVFTKGYCFLNDYYMQTVISSENGAEANFSVCTVGDSTGNCYAMFDYFVPDSMITIPEYNLIQFIDYSFPLPVAWEWNFGDGSSSTEQNPLHSYLADGSYEVCLTTIAPDGCSSSYCMPVYLTSDTIIDPYCYTYFGYFGNADNYIDSSSTSISFYDYSYPTPVSWTWDFGDGITSNEASPVHTYERSGVYMVCLNTYTADSCSGYYCENIFVGINDTINWPDCQAMFYTYPGDSIFTYTGEYPVTFVDVSFGNPVMWHWDFGDGFTSDAQNPVHFYEKEGIYNVSLNIVNANSCSNSITMPVWVWNYNDSINDWMCMASFYSQRIEEANCLCYQFYDQSVGDVIEWNWDFGDGTTSTLQNPMHSFGDSIYWVSLQILTSDGCSSIITSPVFTNDSIWIIFSEDGDIPIDSVWMPLDTCVLDLGANTIIDSAYIESYHLMDSFKVEVVWIIWQNGNSETITVIYPVNHDGTIMFFLAIRCAGSKSTNVLTLADVITLKYSMLSVNKKNVDETWVLYPNPATDFLQIQSDIIMQGTKITVVDILGKSIQKTCVSGKCKNYELDITDLQTGIYFVRIETSAVTKTLKFKKE